LALCASFALTPAGADHVKEKKNEFPLKYRLAFVSVAQEVGHGGQYLEPKTRDKRGDGEPRYQSKQPLYCTVVLGAKKQNFTMVFDASSGKDQGHDTLHFDADGDGKFTAKERFAGVARDMGNLFGPVKVMVDCHGDGHEKCPQWFLVQYSEYDYGNGQLHRRAQLFNAGYYEGKVRFGDKEVLIAFADADGNGLYNSVMKPGAEGNNDRLLLDTNGDGKLDGGYNSEESQPLGRFIEVAGKYWQLDPSPDGAGVSIAPLERPLGQLKAEAKDYTLLLTGDDGVLQVRSKDGTARVPAGKYRLYQCNYKLPFNGKLWKFQGHCGNDGVAVDVPPDGEVRIPFGAPLVPKIVVNRNGADLNLSLVLKGAGQETYQDVQIGDNYQRPPVPKVRILDDKGKELAQLDFHYG
jgi:hypothetical protein